jgi:chromosome partitioning protein
MQAVSLVCQKGGAGKTTLAVHLAVEGTARGLRTLLIDLDPQASAGRWADRRGDRPPDVASEQPARLEAALAGAEAEGYELVLIDTAPHADQAALRAARAAGLVLVPCRPSILDLDAIEATLDLCQLARKEALVVLNAAPVRSRVVDDAQEAIQRLGGKVASAIVHERVAFRHALVDGRVAQEYEPGGTAAAEIGALFALLGCKHPSVQSGKPVSEKA